MADTSTWGRVMESRLVRPISSTIGISTWGIRAPSGVSMASLDATGQFLAPNCMICVLNLAASTSLERSTKTEASFAFAL